VNAPASKYQIELLHHTLGLSEHRRESRRNYFVAGDGHMDMQHLEALERAGLMERRATPKFLAADDVVFAATDSGLDVAIASLPVPRKRTRYEEYLDADGCGGDSFGEFLCGARLPEFEGKRDFRARDTKYRMFRRADHWTRDVEGEWCKTKKEAKASYKAALKARKA